MVFQFLVHVGSLNKNNLCDFSIFSQKPFSENPWEKR